MATAEDRPEVGASVRLDPVRRVSWRTGRSFALLQRALFEALAVMVLTPLVLTVLVRAVATPAYFQRFAQVKLSDEVIAVRLAACGADRSFLDHLALTYERTYKLDFGVGLRSGRPLDKELWPRMAEMGAFLIPPAVASVLVGFLLATFAWLLPFRRVAVRMVASANLVPYPLLLVMLLLLAGAIHMPTAGAMSVVGEVQWVDLPNHPTNSFFWDSLLAGRFDLVLEWMRYAAVGMTGLALALGLGVAALILKTWNDLEAHPILESMRGIGFGRVPRFLVRMRLSFPVVMGLMGYQVLMLPAGAILTEALTNRSTSLGGYATVALLQTGDLNALVGAVILVAWTVAILHVGWQSLTWVIDPMGGRESAQGKAGG